MKIKDMLTHSAIDRIVAVEMLELLSVCTKVELYLTEEDRKYYKKLRKAARLIHNHYVYPGMEI